MEQQSNKIGRNQGKKITIDGYKFDSHQEADFYVQFIKGAGLPFQVHPTYPIIDKFAVGGINMRGLTYTPDFVIKDSTGRDRCFDVKNSFTGYGVNAEAKLKFKLFAKRYNSPVEVVIPRKGWFWLKIMSTTRKFEPLRMTTVDYNLAEIIGQ